MTPSPLLEGAAKSGRPPQREALLQAARRRDTFYVIEGLVRVSLREPEEEVRLGPGDTYSVRPRRPHCVVNGGEGSATFLVLQGIGVYDYVPLA